MRIPSPAEQNRLVIDRVLQDQTLKDYTINTTTSFSVLLRILPQKIEVSRAGACDAKFHRGLRRGFPRHMACDYSDQLVHIAQH
jgi:hypothetical protein